jgi:hypothetical protein
MVVPERFKKGLTMRTVGSNPELSETQREIINHRLEAADAIIDVMSEGREQYEGYDPIDLEQVIDALQDGEWLEAQNFSEQMVADILRDCVEGSTLPALYADACQNGEAIQSEYHKLIREGDELAKKIQEIDPCDRHPVKFPRC